MRLARGRRVDHSVPIMACRIASIAARFALAAVPVTRDSLRPTRYAARPGMRCVSGNPAKMHFRHHRRRSRDSRSRRRRWRPGSRWRLHRPPNRDGSLRGRRRYPRTRRYREGQPNRDGRSRRRRRRQGPRPHRQGRLRRGRPTRPRTRKGFHTPPRWWRALPRPRHEGPRHPRRLDMTAKIATKQTKADFVRSVAPRLSAPLDPITAPPEEPSSARP